MKCAIYDYETLGRDVRDLPIISFAVLLYDDEMFINEEPYTYDELLEMCDYYKFDVADQVKNYGRVINQDTLNWWKDQNEEARKLIAPKPDDLPLTKLYVIIKRIVNDYDPKRIFARSNTFDPMITKFAINALGYEDPTKHWTVRDTRSYIDALLYGVDLSNKFFPPTVKEEQFVHHDPRHDIALDVMRMQYLIRTVHTDYEV